jgi:hypothetical protein
MAHTLPGVCHQRFTGGNFGAFPARSGKLAVLVLALVRCGRTVVFLLPSGARVRARSLPNWPGRH